MSGSVEASRRHGAFDVRWPKRRLRVAAVSLAPAPGVEDVPDGLDWEGFSTRYFPGRRRHDLEVISAYDAYKHGRLGRRDSRPKPRRRSIRLNEPVLRVEAKRHDGTAAGDGRRASILERARSEPMTATTAGVVEAVESAEPTTRSAQQVAERGP